MGILIEIGLIQLDDLQRCLTIAQRFGKRLRFHEVHVVGRSMIFGVLAVRASAETSDSEVKSWRTILSLVIAIGNKVDDVMSLA